MAKDQNHKSTALAKDTNGNPAPLKVDPITGRLIIEIYAVSNPVNHVLNTNNKIDENYKEASLAVYNNDNVIPLHIDNTNGYLFVDINDESGVLD